MRRVLERLLSSRWSGLADRWPLTRLAELTHRMDGSEVIRVFAAVQAHGADAWIGGGWGIEALAGRQRRPHSDLDLLCPGSSEAEDEVRAALEEAGYRLLTERTSSYRPLPRRLIYTNGAGGIVDLIPVPHELPPFGLVRSARNDNGTWSGTALAVGSVEGVAVTCLSTTCQEALHSGYRSRRRDDEDLDVLRQLGPTT